MKRWMEKNNFHMMDKEKLLLKMKNEIKRKEELIENYQRRKEERR